jgi:hypothetical protein
MLDVADISCLHAMLSNQPELVSDVSIAHRRPPWLARLPSFCFEQRISGQRQTHRKRELDWRVQHVFLKRVGDSMLHSRSLTVPPVNWKARNLPCRTTYTVEIVIFRCHSPDRENQTHNELNFYGYTFAERGDNLLQLHARNDSCPRGMHNPVSTRQFLHRFRSLSGVPRGPFRW